MAALPYMQLYVADYLADTSHLNAAQHGAYLLLLMNYWQRGKAIPDSNDRLAIVARMTNEQWNDNRAVVAEFFEIINGEWVHHRVEKDLLKVKGISNAGKIAGMASAKARKERASNDRSNTVPTVDERKPNHTDTDIDTDIKKSTSINSLIEVRENTEEYANLWNETRGPDLPKVTKLTPSRKDKVKTRINQGLTLQSFSEVITLCRKSDFLSGRETAWKATFDWLMENDNNWVKVFEGNYINGNLKGRKNEQRTAVIEQNNNGIGEWLNQSIGNIVGGPKGNGEAVSSGELPSQGRPVLGSGS